jgi:hypothetical protein
VELILLQEALQEKADTPSPLTGEGWGEGEKKVFSIDYIPFPSIPSRQGRGKGVSGLAHPGVNRRRDK